MAGLFAFNSYQQNYQLKKIESSWLSFKSHYAEKARLETSLRAVLGYGGMIHAFKNYILRKDQKDLEKFQQNLGAAKNILSKYTSLARSEAEKNAIEDIRHTLGLYEKGMDVARAGYKKGKTTKQVDRLISVDDRFALRGLEALRQEIIHEYSYYGNKQEKSVLASAIRTSMGYGAMIHNFKRYVIRGEEKYYKLALQDIDDSLKNITDYKNLNPTLGETNALNDIVSTILEYKSRLLLVKKLQSKKLSPEEIDRQVRVDDRRALRGLATLDNDVVQQITLKSNNLSQDLSTIRAEQKNYTYLFITSILILTLLLFYIFTQVIIKPVRKLSVVMSELSQGNTNVSFDYPERSRTEMGDIASAFKIFRDNEQKRVTAENEIRRLAMTDPLTGLSNRNQFDRRYDEMVSLADRENKLIAVLALDLDEFKPINDSHGHAVGDEILKSVAGNLLLVFRETDVVARIGGDEFSILLYGPENLEAVENVAQRIISLLSLPVPVGAETLLVGVSIGITLRESKSPLDKIRLLCNADQALYEAKKAGKNTYRVYEAE